MRTPFSIVFDIMTTAILLLAVSGILLLAAEVFVPGGILGALGSLCLLAGVVLVYMEGGWLAALGALALSFILAMVAFYAEIKILERTKLGRSGILSASLQGSATAPQAAADIVGKCGEVMTPMNPTGMVRVEGALYEAASIDGSLGKGEQFVIVGQDNFRLLVKKVGSS